MLPESTALELEGPFITAYMHAEVIYYPVGPNGEVNGTVALHSYTKLMPTIMSLDRYRRSVEQGHILSSAEYNALLSLEIDSK